MEGKQGDDDGSDTVYRVQLALMNFKGRSGFKSSMLKQRFCIFRYMEEIFNVVSCFLFRILKADLFSKIRGGFSLRVMYK